MQGPFVNREMAHATNYPADATTAPPPLDTTLSELPGQYPSRTMLTAGDVQVTSVAVAPCLSKNPRILSC